MQVVLGDEGEFVVHHVRQLIDVQSAGSNIRSDQNPHSLALEVLEGPGACPLALVAMDGKGGDPVHIQLLGEAVGAVLRPGEDENLLPVAGMDQVGKELALAITVDGMDDLGHQLRSGILRRHLDSFGRNKEFPGKLPDRIGERGGKEQVLTRPGEETEDLPDGSDESHIEHAVGFVQDEYLDPGEVDRLLFDVVLQPPRGGYDDIDTSAEGRDLGTDAYASEDDGRPEMGEVFPVRLHARLDLSSKFAGRCENEGANRAGST